MSISGLEKIKEYRTEEYENWRDQVKSGNQIYLSGYMYTARDAAHKRFESLLDQGNPLPFEIKGAFIYYAGPTPAKPGEIIGSIGPTTSSRMDKFAARLLDLGLKGIIGKGFMSDQVKKSLILNRAIYFCALGGAGALAARAVKSAQVVAFEDLGCESVKKIYVEKFPLWCAYDLHGGDIYNRV